MKQLLEFNTTLPDTSYDLSLRKIYQEQNGLIVVLAIKTSGVGLCEIQKGLVNITIDTINSDSQLPVTYFVVHGMNKGMGQVRENQSDCSSLSRKEVNHVHSDEDIIISKDSKCIYDGQLSLSDYGEYKIVNGEAIKESIRATAGRNVSPIEISLPKNVSRKKAPHPSISDQSPKTLLFIIGRRICRSAEEQHIERVRSIVQSMDSIEALLNWYLTSPQNESGLYVSTLFCILADAKRSTFIDEKRAVFATIQQNDTALQYLFNELIRLWPSRNRLCSGEANLAVLATLCLETISLLVEENPSLLEKYAGPFKNDKEFALKMVEKNSLALQYLSDELQTDPEVVAASNQPKNGSAQRYASANLKNDQGRNNDKGIVGAVFRFFGFTPSPKIAPSSSQERTDRSIAGLG